MAAVHVAELGYVLCKVDCAEVCIGAFQEKKDVIP